MSDYAKSLPEFSRRRSYEKLTALGLDNLMDGDPYLDDELQKSMRTKKNGKIVSSWTENVLEWPEIEFGDIYTYFINTPGPFTCDTMKAYRSLDAFTFYIDGWVHTCYHLKTDMGYCIIKAKVNRSQAVTDDPHRAWVAIREKDKYIEFGHCTCMAGLGEVCSHVAAILYKVEAGVRIRPSVSCTDEPCKWNQTFVKKVEAVPLAEINFDNPKKKRKRPNFPIAPVQVTNIANPMELLKDLRKTAPNAVVFTVLDPKKSEPEEDRLPPNLFCLYNEDYKSLSSGDFKQLCEKNNFSIRSSDEQNEYLEENTRKQSKSRLWHQYRAGRITSSNFYAAVHTDIDKPSTSLIKKIVYGQTVNTVAIKWGNNNESIALEEYTSYVGLSHTNLHVKNSGFVINKKYPFLGSSPDGLVECDCCGKGAIEIKCPFKYKDEDPCTIDDRHFCLEPHDLCDNSLKVEHPYFYQVQGQMGICDLSYCDFVCYTRKGLHVERIFFDSVFFRNVASKLTTFYKSCILTELLQRNLVDGKNENQPVNRRTRKNKELCL